MNVSRSPDPSSLGSRVARTVRKSIDFVLPLFALASILAYGYVGLFGAGVLAENLFGERPFGNGTTEVGLANLLLPLPFWLLAIGGALVAMPYVTSYLHSGRDWHGRRFLDVLLVLSTVALVVSAFYVRSIQGPSVCDRHPDVCEEPSRPWA
jgi:hypothetical protein